VGTSVSNRAVERSDSERVEGRTSMIGQIVHRDESRGKGWGRSGSAMFGYVHGGRTLEVGRDLGFVSRLYTCCLPDLRPRRPPAPWCISSDCLDTLLCLIVTGRVEVSLEDDDDDLQLGPSSTRRFGRWGPSSSRGKRRLRRRYPKRPVWVAWP
jgi:hypothetical protein